MSLEDESCCTDPNRCSCSITPILEVFENVVATQQLVLSRCKHVPIGKEIQTSRHQHVPNRKEIQTSRHQHNRSVGGSTLKIALDSPATWPPTPDTLVPAM